MRPIIFWNCSAQGNCLSTHKYPIGTENESSLHRTLKFHYAGPDGRTEFPVGSYVADGINAKGEFIEVQTGSFGPLKAKVNELSGHGKVRIIHPVAIAKYIEVYDIQPCGKKTKKSAQKSRKRGKLSFVYRRKSPLKGSAWSLFDALLYAPELVLVPGLSIEIVLADIVEKRVRDGKGSWRRKGVSIMDRELETWHESILLEKPKDYRRFVPFKKNEVFTSSLLAVRAGITMEMAGKALYVLTKLNIVKRTGKKGRSWLYAPQKTYVKP